MATEEWEKLGLGNDKLESGAKDKGAAERTEATGFVAGARSAKRRKERYKKETAKESGG